MGKSKNQVAKREQYLNEDSILIVNEVNQVGTPTPEFDEAKYWIWESKMVVYLSAHGYYVWKYVVFEDTSVTKSRR